MSSAAHAVHALASTPEVSSAVDRARAACTELRWHNALRKRMDECRAESTVRATRSSAALEGARFPISYVRELFGAGREVADDYAGLQMAAALRTGALTADLQTTPEPLRHGLAPVLAKLSVAASAGLVDPAQVGRPRIAGETPGDLSGLPPAPAPAEVAARLAALDELLADPKLPGLVVASLIHGEILALRPFVVGNGLVARALFRIHLVSSGVDPTGVAVSEAALQSDATGYGQAGAGYTSGSDVIGWIVACAEAVTTGAEEGRRVCTAVQSGRAPRNT